MPECHKKYSITGNYRKEERTDLQISETTYKDQWRATIVYDEYYFMSSGEIKLA